MAKKVRRVKKKKRKQAASRQPADSVVEDASGALDSSVNQSLSATEQFRLDYAYVVKDLRRVLLLAGALFTLLIVLNLLLQ